MDEWACGRRVERPARSVAAVAKATGPLAERLAELEQAITVTAFGHKGSFKKYPTTRCAVLRYDNGLSDALGAMAETAVTLS